MEKYVLECIRRNHAKGYSSNYTVFCIINYNYVIVPNPGQQQTCVVFDARMFGDAGVSPAGLGPITQNHRFGLFFITCAAFFDHQFYCTN